MSETRCKKCGKPITAGDKFCPACGHPIARKFGKQKIPRNDHYLILGILIVVAVVYIGYKAFATRSEPNDQQSHMHGTTGAQDEIESFLQNLPTEFNSLVSMGNRLMDQGRYELAVECYKRALEQKPEDGDVRVDLGTCRHALGLDREAIADFEKALEYNPDHQVAKFNLGIVHYTLGEVNQAIDWWNRLLAENPPQNLRTRTEELLLQAQGN